MDTKIFIEDPKDEENVKSEICRVSSKILCMLKLIMSLLFLFFCSFPVTMGVLSLRTCAEKVRPQPPKLIPVITVDSKSLLTFFGLNNVSNYDCYDITITVLRIEEQGRPWVSQWNLQTVKAEVITEVGVIQSDPAKNYRVTVEGIWFPKIKWICLANQPCQMQVEAQK